MFKAVIPPAATFISALASSSNCTTSKWPAPAAIWMGALQPLGTSAIGILRFLKVSSGSAKFQITNCTFANAGKGMSSRKGPPSPRSLCLNLGCPVSTAGNSYHLPPCEGRHPPAPGQVRQRVQWSAPFGRETTRDGNRIWWLPLSPRIPMGHARMSCHFLG